jgi:hypothetical protein
MPFRVGETITGTFTYDLDGANQYPAGLPYGAYKSPRNAFSFRLGKQHFSGTGDVQATASAHAGAEHFQVVAFDLQLPNGWKMDHAGPSQTYGILLQKVPGRGALPGPGLPKRVRLASFANTRELRLDFFKGVQFPGGRVNGRATAFATVETLEELTR